MSDNKPYTITETANKLGVSTHALRYYEQSGLIMPTRSNNRRSFTSADIEWLEIILLLRDTGMSIRGIRELLNLRQRGFEGMRDRIAYFKAYKTELEQQIMFRQRAIKTISHKIEKHTKQLKEYEEK